ncbi:MAG: hypothetical protein KAS32_25250 [Candidatus Peribacteraceae bacterium]|nr:hypothetical protein [Candidatus Peribacteraceae bacterium]
MEQELKAALVDVINKSIEVAGNATDFIMAEIPNVAQQILKWSLAEAAIYCLVWLGITMMFPIISRKMAVKDSDPDWKWCGLIGLFPFIGVIENLRTMLYIYLAPKLFLIEYTANLVRPVTQ